MFFQPPDEELQSAKPIQNNLRRRRKKKFSNKQANKKEASKRKQLRLATTMSSWAESFTSAATWQLKHQIAYWKSRAKALEYENQVLHGIIRDNYMNPKDSKVSDSDPKESSVTMENDEESDSEVDNEEDEVQEHENFEVSEEFIQFLTENAKYKEDARRERERLKAQYESNDGVEELEAGPPESQENKQESLKQLYGDKWQKISALETYLHSQFISKSDSDKPMYWPNIPLNFNFS